MVNFNEIVFRLLSLLRIDDEWNYTLNRLKSRWDVGNWKVYNFFTPYLVFFYDTTRRCSYKLRCLIYVYITIGISTRRVFWRGWNCLDISNEIMYKIVKHIKVPFTANLKLNTECEVFVIVVIIKLSRWIKNYINLLSSFVCNFIHNKQSQMHYSISRIITSNSTLLTTPFTKPIKTHGKIAVDPVWAVTIVRFLVTKIDVLEDKQSLFWGFLCLCLIMWFSQR